MSHLAITLIAGKIIGLNTGELLAAVAGGTILDLDHIFMLHKRKKDTPDFWQKLLKHNGQMNLHSWLHEPLIGLIFGVITGIIISILFFNIRWWVFPLFISGHILLDLSMKFEHQFFAPFGKKKHFGLFKSGTKKEFAFSSAILWLITIFIK